MNEVWEQEERQLTQSERDFMELDLDLSEALNDRTNPAKPLALVQPAEHKFHVFNGEITSPTLKLFVGGEALRESFLRIMIATDSLAKSAFDLPQKKLASQLGCTQPAISLIIKRAMQFGILTCTNSTYKVGIKAKTYQAVGHLKAAILMAMKTRKPKFQLPTNIKAGTYDRVLIVCAKAFIGKPKAFLAWLNTIPGFRDKKDRVAKANHALECRERYQSKLKLVA